MLDVYTNKDGDLCPYPAFMFFSVFAFLKPFEYRQNWAVPLEIVWGSVANSSLSLLVCLSLSTTGL